MKIINVVSDFKSDDVVKENSYEQQTEDVNKVTPKTTLNQKWCMQWKTVNFI